MPPAHPLSPEQMAALHEHRICNLENAIVEIKDVMRSIDGSLRALVTLETELRGMQGAIKRAHGRIDDIDDCLYGSGDKVGIVGRAEAQDVSIKGHTWTLRLVAAAFVAQFVAAVLKLMYP